MRIPKPDEPERNQALEIDAAGFGLVVAGGQRGAEDTFYLWPECDVTWGIWLRVQTQWYTDNGRRTGLNYPGVEVILKHAPIKKKSRAEQLRLLQEMELAALDAWSD